MATYHAGDARRDEHAGPRERVVRPQDQLGREQLEGPNPVHQRSLAYNRERKVNQNTAAVRLLRGGRLVVYAIPLVVI